MLDTCPIARDEINVLWAHTRGTLDAMPQGDDVRLKLRISASGEAQVAVSGGDQPHGGDQFSFAQVNAEVAALLRNAVIEAVATSPGRPMAIFHRRCGGGASNRAVSTSTSRPDSASFMAFFKLDWDSLSPGARVWMVWTSLGRGDAATQEP